MPPHSTGDTYPIMTTQTLSHPIESVIVDPTEHFAHETGLTHYFNDSTAKSILFSEFTDDATLLIEWLNDPSLSHLKCLDVILEMLPEYGGEFSPVYPEKFEITNGTFAIGPEEGGKIYFPKLILERATPDSTADPERVFVYEDNVVAIVNGGSYDLYELD